LANVNENAHPSARVTLVARRTRDAATKIEGDTATDIGLTDPVRWAGDVLAGIDLLTIAIDAHVPRLAWGDGAALPSAQAIHADSSRAALRR